MQIAILTDAEHPFLTPDDQRLVGALARHKIQSSPLIWQEVSAESLPRFAGVLVRSPWDYFHSYDAFLGCLDTLEASRVPVWNSPKMMRWNSQKRYLQELERWGVATIPTEWMRGGDVSRRPIPWDTFVIKPEVSGGGHLTYRVRPGDTLPELPPMLPVMVQPYLQGILEGELSLVFFGGIFSHMVRKLPRPGGFLIHEEHGGRCVADQPPPWLLAVAQAVVERVAEKQGEVPLYARVDGVIEAGEFLLMELELFEPALYLGHAPDSEDRLAALIAKQLAKS